MKLYYLITTSVQLTLPMIRVGWNSACSTCYGVIAVTDIAKHIHRVAVNLENGHYGLWMVGEDPDTRYANELILVSPFGFYFSVGGNLNLLK